MHFTLQPDQHDVHLNQQIYYIRYFTVFFD